MILIHESSCLIPYIAFYRYTPTMSTGEAYERQLRWRLKQMELGKSSDSYRLYMQQIPKNRRGREHPTTPDPYDARMSKRQFEGRIKAWRSSVKLFAENQVSTDSAANSGFQFAFFLRPTELRNHAHLKTTIILQPQHQGEGKSKK